MRGTLIAMVFCGCLTATPLAAQQHGGAQAGPAGDGGKMGHAMMARMDSLGARLDSLTRAMNEATGSRKVNAMAEVLTTLVGHHLEMQRHMHEGMMGGGGAGEHGQARAGKDCPKAGSGQGTEPAHNH